MLGNEEEEEEGGGGEHTEGIKSPYSFCKATTFLSKKLVVEGVHGPRGGRRRGG